MAAILASLPVMSRHHAQKFPQFSGVMRSKAKSRSPIKKTNLFDRMNRRIDRICKSDSPAGGAYPLSSAEHRRKVGEKSEIV